MDQQGMVHALEEIRRLLKHNGVLIDILPKISFVKVYQGGRTLFSERRRESCSEGVLQAEVALEQAVERDLFVADRSAEFEFLRYASSARELSDYWNELYADDASPRDEAVVAREEDLFAQAAQIMQASRAGAEVAILERVRIARLRPVR